MGLQGAFPFLDQDFGCFIKALATLGPLAQSFIDGIGIAAVAAGRLSQIMVADRIADADEHKLNPFDSEYHLNANGLQ